ncbi:DUF397 domain-containing protein [Gandjariella thermophila]|uniref:DUF397 domain-containing protein n=1 Tax=Gandjariella thermophila TaxID=1931992 RepID=A0A4D4JH57_9PSEU|nr:DUF397 domain-containing protein [Gandjariella thermophila]GDY33227.1 hypothetical protein GTS_48600 [Gandjariella thermophila]
MNAPDLSRATWRKSSRSAGNGGACVEIAHVAPSMAAVRDSKNPTGPALVLPAAAWDAFREATKGGTFDLA